MSSILYTVIALAVFSVILCVLVFWLLQRQRRLRSRLNALHEEVRDVASDASVGRRLHVNEDEDLEPINSTINQSTLRCPWCERERAAATRPMVRTLRRRIARSHLDPQRAHLVCQQQRRCIARCRPATVDRQASHRFAQTGLPRFV